MGNETPRLTQQNLKVLKLFNDDPGTQFAGAQIMKATGLSSGTLYPILVRFETYGLLESAWEQSSPESLGRPQRRFYSITARGRAVARGALAELSGSPLLQTGLSGAHSCWNG